MNIEGEEIFGSNAILSKRKLARYISTARNYFYQEYSGNKAALLPTYKDLLKKYGFTIDNVLRHNQGKAGREQCLFFSEIVLKNSPAANQEDIAHVNFCSRAYIGLLESGELLVNKEISYFVSFVPNKCSHYVADAIDFFVPNFKGTHIFMDTVNTPKKEELYKRVVYYKKDSGIHFTA